MYKLLLHLVLGQNHPALRLFVFVYGVVVAEEVLDKVTLALAPGVGLVVVVGNAQVINFWLLVCHLLLV
jgi:hypothetical protein